MSEIGGYVRAGITIEQGRSFNDLLAILAALAFEGLVRLALGVFIKQKQFSEGADRKVTLCIFLLIYHGRRKGLLGCLTLEYLFFYSPCGYETIDEACPEPVKRMVYERKVKQCNTNILSFDHRARRVPKLVGLPRDSNLRAGVKNL